MLIYLSTLGRNANQNASQILMSLRKIAPKMKSKIQFTYTDENFASSWKEMMQIQQEGDTLVLFNPVGGFYHLFPSSQPMKTSNIENWILSILNGQILSNKRQPTGYPTHYPANERDLVLKLSTSNWEQVLNSHDVLVAFVQPWHAASKRLWPILLQVAKSLDKVANVALFDCHTQALPTEMLASKYQLQISKYPTIVLFKQDGMASVYHGIFSVEKLLAWALNSSSE